MRTNTTYSFGELNWTQHINEFKWRQKMYPSWFIWNCKIHKYNKNSLNKWYLIGIWTIYIVIVCKKEGKKVSVANKKTESKTMTKRYYIALVCGKKKILTNGFKRRIQRKKSTHKYMSRWSRTPFEREKLFLHSHFYLSYEKGRIFLLLLSMNSSTFTYRLSKIQL